MKKRHDLDRRGKDVAFHAPYRQRSAAVEEMEDRAHVLYIDLGRSIQGGSQVPMPVTVGVHKEWAAIAMTMDHAEPEFRDFRETAARDAAVGKALNAPFSETAVD